MKRILTGLAAAILAMSCASTADVATLHLDIPIETINLEPSIFSGGVYLSGFKTAMEYDSIVVQDRHGKVLFADDFSTRKSSWEDDGTWKVENGVASMDNADAFDNRFANYAGWDAAVITCKGRKVGGSEGLCLAFAAQDPDTWYRINFAGWGNARTALQKAGAPNGNVVAECYDAQYQSLPMNEWVTLKIVMQKNNIKCYVNGGLAIDYYETDGIEIPTPGKHEYINPESKTQRPDPFVMHHTDGYYYGTHTMMNSSGYSPQLALYRSKTLSDLFSNKDNRKIIFKAPKGKGRAEWNSADIWAPEIYNFDGTWYVYYSLSNFKIGALSNTSANPMEGEWKDEGQILDSEGWAIDPSLFRQNGKLYILWSGIPIDGMQRIYVQQMETPTRATGDKLEISKPEYEWERRGTKDIHDVNEGPIALQHGGKTFVIYSASFCVSPWYCLGMLTCDGKADPMKAESWTKADKPVFESAPDNGIWAPGHNGFTVSPDGKEDWIIYHAMMMNIIGGERVLCMQKFTWNADGTPSFGVPQGRFTTLKKPSGE